MTTQSTNDILRTIRSIVAQLKFSSEIPTEQGQHIIDLCEKGLGLKSEKSNRI